MIAKVFSIDTCRKEHSHWCNGDFIGVYSKAELYTYSNPKMYEKEREDRSIENGCFFCSKDKNQEVEIKLEGKNVSPAPERRK